MLVIQGNGIFGRHVDVVHASDHAICTPEGRMAGLLPHFHAQNRAGGDIWVALGLLVRPEQIDFHQLASLTGEEFLIVAVKSDAFDGLR